MYAHQCTRKLSSHTVVGCSIDPSTDSRVGSPTRLQLRSVGFICAHCLGCVKRRSLARLQSQRNLKNCAANDLHDASTDARTRTSRNRVGCACNVCGKELCTTSHTFFAQDWIMTSLTQLRHASNGHAEKPVSQHCTQTCSCNLHGGPSWSMAPTGCGSVNPNVDCMVSTKLAREIQSKSCYLVDSCLRACTFRSRVALASNQAQFLRAPLGTSLLLRHFQCTRSHGEREAQVVRAMQSSCAPACGNCAAHNELPNLQLATLTVWQHKRG